MESLNNQTNFDTQHQSLIATKKFRYPAGSAPMAEPESSLREDFDGVTLRCRALEEHYAEGNGFKFATLIEVEYPAWNAAVNSGKVSKAIAFQIRRKYPEISLEWLWFGLTDRQLPMVTAALDAAMMAAAVRLGLTYPATGKGSTRAP